MAAETRVALDIAAQVGARLEPRERERRLLGLAERQHGVVAASQIRSLGLTAQGIGSRVRAGRLHRVHRGVFAVGRPDLAVEGRWMAAVLACGRGALLSHASAAALHDLLSTASSRVDVTIPREATLSRPGIRVHCSAYLDAADQARRKEIPCTSVARTLLDLAAVAPNRVVERACEQAELKRLLDWSVMEALLTRARGRRGVRSLRAALASVGRGIPRSELERRFLDLCREAALPSPAVNQWLTVAGEEMQVDFVWHGRRLVVETDGFHTHATRQAFARDRSRDRLLSLEGWSVLRFTWDDVTGEPKKVIGQVRELLEPCESRLSMHRAAEVGSRRIGH